MEQKDMTQTVHTAEKRFICVEHRAGCYRTQFELGSDDVNENLTRDPAMAILCFDFADLVVQGNNLYESINSLDNDWRKLVYAEAIPFEESYENRLKRLYAGWLDVSKKVVELYNKIESEYASRGFDAAPIHELRRAIREVEGMQIDDSQFFAHPKLIALRDAAIDDARGNVNIEFLADPVQ
jgi:hypothetical protein